MAAKTVLNYLPRESVVHKLTGTTKLAFFLLFTFASMITYNTYVLLVLLAVSLAAFKLSRIKFREVRFMLVFMLVFLLLNNLMSLFGLKNPTSDISVTGAIALITFTLTQINRARTGKLKGFLHAFIEPMPFMLPFNIIGEIANPLSQALRIFGNMVAGMVIGGLIYFALGNFAILVPAITSLYFDIFSAVIQAYIFTTLTMAYISGAECE